MASTQRFTWTAHNIEGIEHRGELMANSARDALAQLRDQGWMGIQLQHPSGLIWQRHHRVGSRDITVMTRQLATMVNADVPLLHALSLMADTTKHMPVLKLLAQLQRDIRGGSSLAQALAQHPDQFDDLYRHVVSAGESSGALGFLLDRLATQRERHEALSAQLRSAMVYPLTVVMVAVAVVVVILLWVVPTFETVYAGFGAALPVLTQGLLMISRGLVQHFVLLCAGLAMGVWGLCTLWKIKRIQYAWDRWSLHWPLVGRLSQLSATTRWTRTLSTLLNAGTPLNQALLSVAGASGHRVYELASQTMAQAVQEGSALTPAMSSCGLFDPMVIQLTAMGEASGALSTLLSKAAELGEHELEAQLQGLSSLIEPVIIVVLGLIIGTIVLALYWPIFELGQVI